MQNYLFPLKYDMGLSWCLQTWTHLFQHLVHLTDETTQFFTDSIEKVSPYLIFFCK